MAVRALHRCAGEVPQRDPLRTDGALLVLTGDVEVLLHSADRPPHEERAVGAHRLDGAHPLHRVLTACPLRGAQSRAQCLFQLEVCPLFKHSSVPLAQGCDPARGRPYGTCLQDHGLILQPGPVTVGGGEVVVLMGMAGGVPVRGLHRVNAVGRLTRAETSGTLSVGGSKKTSTTTSET